MFTYQLGDREFNFDPRLRATEKIKSVFKRDYTKLIHEIDTLGIKDLIKFIHAVLAKDEDITFEDFAEWCFDNLGKGDIEDCVSWLVMQLQYPGITEDEFLKKMQENLQKEKQLSTQQD